MLDVFYSMLLLLFSIYCMLIAASFHLHRTHTACYTAAADTWLAGAVARLLGKVADGSLRHIDYNKGEL